MVISITRDFANRRRTRKRSCLDKLNRGNPISLEDIDSIRGLGYQLYKR